MVNFYPAFVLPEGQVANVSTVADHVDWMAGIMGREQYVIMNPYRRRKEGYRGADEADYVGFDDSVGLGSDYDGIETVPEGLEDVSKYPALVSLSTPLPLGIR